MPERDHDIVAGRRYRMACGEAGTRESTVTETSSRAETSYSPGRIERKWENKERNITKKAKNGRRRAIRLQSSPEDRVDDAALEEQDAKAAKNPSKKDTEVSGVIDAKA